MGEQELKAVTCRCCGAPLPENLKCEYCRAQHAWIDLGWAPAGHENKTLFVEHKCGFYDCQFPYHDCTHCIYSVYMSGVWGEGPTWDEWREESVYADCWPEGSDG